MKIRNLILVLLVVTTLLVGALGLAGRTTDAAANAASNAACVEIASVAWLDVIGDSGTGPIFWVPKEPGIESRVAWNS
jgi:hypothetical protein